GDDENDNVVNTGLDFPRVDVLALGNAILNLAPGTISGQVFNDLNGDGSKAGDPGLSGWTTYLDRNNNNALDAGTTTVNSTDIPKTISDLTTFRSTLTVGGNLGPITDVNVKLNITHTFDADVDVYLISPSGRRVMLFTDVGSSGDNFNNTILDDQA